MSRFIPILVLFAVAGLGGCAAPGGTYEFPQAVARLSDQLMSQFRTHQLLSPISAVSGQLGAAAKRDSGAFVMDPFVDANTGYVTRASEEITPIFARNINDPAAGRQVVALAPGVVDTSRYVIAGAIAYENYQNGPTKSYRLYASIIDLTNGDVDATAAVWVSDRKIDDVPTEFYKGSPMYLKDHVLQEQLAAAKGNAGGGRAVQFVQSLDTETITNEASKALVSSDYPKAIDLFKQSIARSDGRTMKNYSGLYQAYYRSRQHDAAVDAFHSLFQLAVENRNVTVKFLFRVDSTDFIGDSDATAQYQIWLAEAARYLATSTQCMTVVGHTSHTGAYDYNMKLSQSRAERIQRILLTQAPGIRDRLHAVGRGFTENLVGTGTDDDQDAIDRRVEFLTTDCRA